MIIIVQTVLKLIVFLDISEYFDTMIIIVQIVLNLFLVIAE